MKNIIPLLTVAAAVSMSACQSGTKTTNNSVDSMSTKQDSLTIEAQIPAAPFDKTVDGKPVKLYYLKSKGGLQAAVTNYGAKIVGLLAPDKEGKFEDVELGYDNIEKYISTKERYYGGIV